MSPKEKANYLHQIFMKPVDELHKYPMCFDTAKQCALLSAESTILALIECMSTGVHQKWALSYWTSVKEEIERIGL